MFGFSLSPNHGNRERGAKPSLIILHYTGMQTAREALARLCDPEAEVSAHYFIDEDGSVKPLVEDKKRAWHAGKSSWRGEADINSHSIGIELVNPGHEFGYRAFPPEQITALADLCRKLMDKHNIPPENVLAHSDVAPRRKTDPGEFFPWEALAAEGIGIWPHPADAEFQAAPGLLANRITLHKKLIKYGYDPECGFEEALTAFHRHFYPEKFGPGQKPSEPDVETAARLLALMKVKSLTRS